MMAGNLRVFEGRKSTVLPPDPDGPDALLLKLRELYTLSPAHVRGMHVIVDHILSTIKTGQAPRVG